MLDLYFPVVELDKKLMGFRRVVVGYHEEMLMRVAKTKTALSSSIERGPLDEMKGVLVACETYISRMLCYSNMMLEMYNKMFGIDNRGESRWRYAILVLGVLVCLTGAHLMAWGHSILGESHTGIATVVGILGIGMISSSRKNSAQTGLGHE